MVTRGGSRAGNTTTNRDGSQNGNRRMRTQNGDRRVRARGGSSSIGGHGDEFADERANLDDVLEEGLDGIDMESPNSGRGSNIPDLIPTHPDHRMMIYPLNSGGFTNIKVNRQIITIFKTMFNGPWTTWKQVLAANRRLMWERFCGLYQWETRLGAIIEKNWESVMKARYADVMSEAREDAKDDASMAGTPVTGGDFNLLKPHHPTWIDAADWEIMIDKVWNTEKWQKKSKIAAKNSGTGAKHTAGSISFEQTRYRMESGSNDVVNSFELYKKCHIRRNQGSASGEGVSTPPEYVTARSRIVAEKYEQLLMNKYGEDVAMHPSIGDFELWQEACGGVKKGGLFGFARPEDPCFAVTGIPSTPSTNSSSLSRVTSTAEIERLSKQLEDRDKIAEEREKAADEREQLAAEREKTILVNMEKMEAEVARQEEIRKEMEERMKEFNEIIRQQRQSLPSDG